MNTLNPSEFFVEDRNNTVRNPIHTAGDELTRVQLTALWCNQLILDKAPAPAVQGRIRSLLDLVDYIGQREPKKRTVKNLIDALRQEYCISAAQILEKSFVSSESPEMEADIIY